MDVTTVHDLALRFLDSDRNGVVASVEREIESGNGVPLVVMLLAEYCNARQRLEGGTEVAIAYERSAASFKEFM